MKKGEIMYIDVGSMSKKEAWTVVRKHGHRDELNDWWTFVVFVCAFLC